jgi:indoleamine 2,3-dioxygenase
MLQQLEAGPSVRLAVEELSAALKPPSSRENSLTDNVSVGSVANGSSSGSSSGLCQGSLVDAYDAAVHELEKFRGQHRGFAQQYIAQWSKKEVGTGGSDFMPALTAYKKTTAEHKMSTKLS